MSTSISGTTSNPSTGLQITTHAPVTPPVTPLGHSVSDIAIQTIEETAKKASSDVFTIVRLATLKDAESYVLKGATAVYRKAFGEPPYCENFSEEDATAILQALAVKGDLIVGMLGENAVSIAGGYQKPGGLYLIDELAVLPETQGKGVGRKTINELIKIVKERQPGSRFELRTTENDNVKALGLYLSLGFKQEPGFEAVPELRQNGQIALDPRIYLSIPMLMPDERQKMLRHLSLIKTAEIVTAVVCDKFPTMNLQDIAMRLEAAWKERQQIGQVCFIDLTNTPDVTARIDVVGKSFLMDAVKAAAWVLTQGKNYKGQIEIFGHPHPYSFVMENGRVSAGPVEQLTEIEALFDGEFRFP